MTTIIEDKAQEETKEYHLKKILELSEKSVGEIPQLDEPTYEQQEWTKRKIWRSK